MFLSWLRVSNTSPGGGRDGGNAHRIPPWGSVPAPTHPWVLEEAEKMKK